MKKFKLDLTPYTVTTDRELEYPLRNNLSEWLRTTGIFRNGNDIAEAVVLAKTIREYELNVLFIDEREAKLLKECLNRFIELTADGKANLGGEIHEEAILRVFNMEEA
jgi:hypothetical protein